MVSNLSTVAVVPITSQVPLSHFTRELCAAICNIGKLIFLLYKDVFDGLSSFAAPALRLTSKLIEEELGSTALDR